MWGGAIWTAGFYINTVRQFANENVIKNYVKNQGKKEEYKIIHRSQIKIKDTMTRLYKVIIFTTLLLFKFTEASAQFSMSIRENFVTKEINTLWNINLAYIGSKDEEELQLKLSLLNDNGKTIYEVLSPYLLLNNKEIRVLNTSFIIAQIITNEVNTNFLPDGKYEVVYSENKSNKQLKRRQFTVNGENLTFNNLADSGKFDVKKWINTTGSARLTTAFNNPQGLQSEQKDFYSRLEFNPTLIFAGQIPVSASILLSTEQNPQKQPINQISLNFDYNYFRTLLEQQAMAKIDEMKSGKGLGEMQNLKEKYIREKNPDYDVLKAKLSSPEVKEQLAQADEYNSLEKQSINLEKEIDKEKTNELKTKYGITTMKDLEVKKAKMPLKDYNDLKFQMTTADAYADVQEQMKKLEGAKNNAKKLEKQQEKLDRMQNTDYMQMMRDPAYNKEILNKLGLNTPVTKLFGSLKSFSVGASYPLYSELTMNGVRSNGFNIELNPGIAYLAFTKGTIRDQHYDTTLNTYEFQQEVTAGRLGIGKKNATHFILSYVNTVEQGNAFITPTNAVTFNPSNNLVAGADLQINLFKNKFVTQAEFNNAYTTSDVHAPDVPNTAKPADQITQTLSKMTEVLTKLNYRPNLTTRMDYAYSVKSEINLFGGNTVLNVYYTYVGPGYATYTSPFLLTDQLKYEGKLNQSFWKKRIAIGGFYRYMTDDLFNSKSFKTTINGYGAEASINFPKFPSLWAKYLPVNQVSDFTVSGQVGKLASNMTMAGSSYNFNFSKVSCNTQLIFTQYDIKDQFWGTNILMSTYMLMHNMAFANGMNWGVTGFYNSSEGARDNDVLGFSLTETSIIKKKVITGIELHYLQESTNTSKTGAMLNVGVKLFKNINTQLKVTYNKITSPLLGNRTETYGYLVISLVW